MSLEEVRSRVVAAARTAGRDPDQVRLVVVSKGRTEEEILEVYHQGQRHFGESRAQELVAKAPHLPDDIVWHFVGPLQRNKVRMVRPVVALLHSMDRLRLSEAWVKGPGLPPPVLVQVNIGHEPQKSGADLSEVPALIERLLALGLEVRGLMAIPPLRSDPHPFFRRLADLRQEVARTFPAVSELSMGMTDDFEAAVAEGATILRVGRAIFTPAAPGDGNRR